MCDEPHPLLVKDMLDHATRADIDQAYKILAHLWELGYSPEDIITNVFRVCKSHNMAEFLKLEFIKEIGRTHLAMAQGTSSLLQVPSSTRGQRYIGKKLLNADKLALVKLSAKLLISKN